MKISPETAATGLGATAGRRFLAVADLHGHLPELDMGGFDGLLIAGDVCPLANHGGYYQKAWLETVFYQWCAELAVPVYLTLGNHDFAARFKAPPNLRYGTAKIVEDILLFSWVPVFGQWAWMAPEAGIARRLRRLLAPAGPGRPRLWLTHGPPWGVGDEVDGQPRGSEALRRAVLKYQPEALVCGHLHEGAARGRLGRTEIFNVALMNDDFELYRRPAVVPLGPPGGETGSI